MYALLGAQHAVGVFTRNSKGRSVDTNDLSRRGVAHIDLPKRRGLRPPPSAIRDMVLPALDAVAEAGMAVEINTSGLLHGAQEMYCSPDILRWMAERGIPVLFGSDAHRPRDIARAFPEAVAADRAAGIAYRAEFCGRERRLLPL